MAKREQGTQAGRLSGGEHGGQKNLHEINRYRDAAFPVGMYFVTKETIIPQGRGYLDLHWHEELQFTLVTSGRLGMQVNGTVYTLEEGEAIFINRNFLHVTTELPDGGRYVSFNFPDKMLGFFSGSRMEQDDVRPFTGNYAFPALVIRRGEPWQEEILRLLRALQGTLQEADEKLAAKAGKKEAGNAVPHLEYRAACLIAAVWYQMISHMELSQLPSRGSVRKQERIQTMLSFIHENYMNPIQLKEIADSASVSEGECCRCFREMVRESPGQYLLSYRVTRAMDLLNESERSVTEVAAETGFCDASHFIQYFRRKTGMTPREYRSKKC